MKVKATSLLGHPQFVDDDVTVDIVDGKPFYRGKPLVLSAKGRKALRFDIRNS